MRRHPHGMNQYGNVLSETAKFLLECNVKFGRQHRGCWQQQSQIDDHLETEFGLRVCLEQNKNTRLVACFCFQKSYGGGNGYRRFS